MFTLRISSNGSRRNVVVDVNTTPRQVFQDEDIDVSGTRLSFDGVEMSASDVGRTFAELGATEGSTCSLVSVVKADGGLR